jgi:hypothetical protein
MRGILRTLRVRGRLRSDRFRELLRYVGFFDELKLPSAEHVGRHVISQVHRIRRVGRRLVRDVRGLFEEEGVALGLDRGSGGMGAGHGGVGESRSSPLLHASIQGPEDLMLSRGSPAVEGSVIERRGRDDSP